ncbi:MAG: ASKHA domain-containing protein [Vicinamibacterales bacterium]
MHARVDWQPIGRRTEVPAGTSVLDAARAAGIELVAVCGGAGLCEGCLVQVSSGRLRDPAATEVSALGAERLRRGWRLACQAAIDGDVTLSIPPESMSAPQRLQVEGGRPSLAPPDRSLRIVDVELQPPSLRDLRAGDVRFAEALSLLGCHHPRPGLALMRGLLPLLKSNAWGCRAVMEGGEILAVAPPASTIAGLAVDIGTTKLAVYLVDLHTGSTLAVAGRMNPQASFGEDVVSRIAWVGDSTERIGRMQALVVGALSGMVDECCAASGVPRNAIVEAVAVGNTAMHHFLAGLPVSSLGEAPYVPVVSGATDTLCSGIGLDLAPGARLHLPPNVAGYVGSDHVAMLLATGVAESERTALAIDIGTNTEMTLVREGRLLTCSCASGPAFEGAHVSHGMRAAAGAVERVTVVDGQLRVHTIGGCPPAGICGSGILDVVAVMRKLGVLDKHGALLSAPHPMVDRSDPRSPEFIVVAAGETATGRAVTVNRRDVNEIQVAKAAIRAGIEVLLEESGSTESSVERVVIAGAFGTYVNLSSAKAVGLLPDFGNASVEQVGNAAGAGAREILMSAGRRQGAIRLAERIDYIELTSHQAFSDKFARAVLL